MSEQTANNANPNATVIPAERSSFTYEAPPETDPQEIADFNALLKDSISDISNEYNPTPEFEPEPTEGGESSAEPEAEPSEASEQSESPEITRGVDRLVQREVALQTKEAAFQQREARVQALETELTQLRQAVPSKDFLDKLDLSPADALKAVGKDPETVVRLLIAEHLHSQGKEVPVELQKFVEQAANNRRIAALERQLADRDKQANEARVMQAVDLGGREYVKMIDKQVDKAGKAVLPTLARISKADPDLAHSELMEEIKAQVARDPNSEMTYATVAAKAEARLARLHKALTGSDASTTPAKPEVGQKVTPPVTKPPAKPIKPWEKRQDDLNAAILEAEREFHRVEAANRTAKK